MSSHQVTACGICTHGGLESLWDLPKLPLTERFGPFVSRDCHSYDQQLCWCPQCGHVQLGTQLPADVLYTAGTYSFRTSASQSARSGTAFFLRCLDALMPGKTFRSLLDVGGNDLYLARELAGRATARCVIDPILAEHDGQSVEGIRVCGRMIEQVDIRAEAQQPDLIACRHTLEHVANPRAVLEQLFAQCHPDAVYLFEIPCFENLMEALRFDAIFHQHYQYYDLSAFRQLLWETGGEYLNHWWNHQGSCGGALVVAFRQTKTRGVRPVLDLPARKKYIAQRLALYQQQMQASRALFQQLPQPIYGFGASLMLATLGYHLRTDFAEMTCVLDDDPAKEGWTYENVPVAVRSTTAHPPAPNASYVITSLENVRPITRRLHELQARRILTPLLV